MKDKEMLRVLVTGATGFVGLNALEALRKREGLEIIAACRTPSKLPSWFKGEVRAGDLRDPEYRVSLVKDVDVVCHIGTWASMWGHKELETEWFYKPTIDLLEQSIAAGVKRFLMTGSMVVSRPVPEGESVDDFAPGKHTGFWPHLDRLIDVENYMKENAQRGMGMVSMRLGHFVGAGNHMGMFPALTPRLRTHLVPWLSGGHARMPLTADEDLGEAYALATIAKGLDNYESFNICGPESPRTREVFAFIAGETGAPMPHFSVPFRGGYAFGLLMEKLNPIMPGHSPFLTRSIVHLSEDWNCSQEYAREKLGYIPQKSWKTAAREALTEIKEQGYPWPQLNQAV